MKRKENLIQTKLDFEVVKKPSSESKSPVKKSTQKKKTGMKNTGNSCYFNCIIQSLFNLPTFYSDLTHKRLSGAQLDQNSFVQTLTEMALNLSGNTINPVEAQKAISRHCKQFANKKQQDAHELFGSCLNIIEKELLPYLKGIKGSYDNDFAFSELPLLYCPTKRNFSFIMQKEFTCQNDQCKEKSILKEIFRDLSLVISAENSNSFKISNLYVRTRSMKTSVLGLLNNYFSTEILERKCAKCSCTYASVNKKIYTLPRILVIHLKRFQTSKSGFSVQKLNENITINTEIQIDQKYVVPEIQDPIYFNKKTELSENFKTQQNNKKISNSKSDDESDNDFKRILEESKIDNMTEEAQIEMAKKLSTNESFNNYTQFDMSKTTQALSESENAGDYGSDTESIDSNDPILVEFEKLNIPKFGGLSSSDAPILPLEEEIKLLDRSIILSPSLELSDRSSESVLPSTLTYHLQAIVKHKGDYTSSGHYVTNILDENNQWNCYDDTTVTKLTKDKATKDLSEKEAYILFYVHSSIFQNL